MECHRVRFQRVHHVDHVLALGVIAGIGPMPGVAAIQQQRVRAIGPDRIHHSCHAVHPAHLAIGLGKR